MKTGKIKLNFSSQTMSASESEFVVPAAPQLQHSGSFEKAKSNDNTNDSEPDIPKES